MKKIAALLLVLAMLFSTTAMAQTVLFENYGFIITLPEDWTFENTVLTEEYAEAGVVHGIDVYSQDKSISMWVEIYALPEGSRSATAITVTEFDGYVSDMRLFFPDAFLIDVDGIPFVGYTETDEDGTYLTAYTWNESFEYGFVFLADKMTDEVLKVVQDIIYTFKII